MLTSVCKQLTTILFVAVVLLSSQVSLARDDAVYTIGSVAVDETADSAAAARDIALSKGQATAFRRLIDRLVPKAEQTRVPPLTSAAQVDLVSGIDVEGEKTSSVRYLATLTVRFSQSAVRNMLRVNAIPFAETSGKPLVVLPVYRAAGTLQLWDSANSWLRAWKSLPPTDALIPLIVPRGDATDIAAISPRQALNGAEGRLDAVAQRYRAAGVVLVVGTLRRDDAARAMVLEVTVNRFGAGAGDSISVRSFSGGEDTTAEGLLLTAAQSVRSDVTEGWKRDNLLRFGQRRELIAVTPLSGLADWVALRRNVGAVASVERVELMSLSLSQAAVRLIYFGDDDQLARAFAQRDMELKQGSVDWELRMVSGDTKSATGSVAPR